MHMLSFSRKTSAPYYAKALGVLVAFADRTGEIKTDLPGNFGEFNSSFLGFSQIVDSDGAVKAKMGDEERVIVAGVTVDLERKQKKAALLRQDVGLPHALVRLYLAGNTTHRSASLCRKFTAASAGA